MSPPQLQMQSVGRLRSVAAPLLLFCVLSSSPRARAFAASAERIYVSTEESGEVVVIDPSAGAVTARIAVGKRPRGMKLSADGRTLYVALSGSPRSGPGGDPAKLPPPDRDADGIGVVDLVANKLLRVFPSGQDPEAFDLSRDGKTLFISNEETAEMTVLDLTAGKVVRRVAVGREPEGVTLRPDGKMVYVTSEEESLIVAVDTTSWQAVARIPVGPRPRSIAITPNGKTAFVTDEMRAEVTVVDLVENTNVGAVKILAQAKTVLGPRPMGLALAPGGKTLYVSNGRGESVSVIDVATREQTRIFDGVGGRPWGIGLRRDGKFLYTANGPSNDVSVIDVTSGKIEKRIPVGGMPWGLVVFPGTATSSPRSPPR
jgi:YVTN family beta-propeller protein